MFCPIFLFHVIFHTFVFYCTKHTTIMKKILPGLGILLGISAVAVTLHTVKHHRAAGISESRSGSEDIDGYIKWEQQRLVDPATGKIPDGIRNLELKFAANLPNDLQATKHPELSSSPSWQMRGPWNVGGRTRAFAADITNEAVLLAGSCAGGMWRSADSGKTWNLTTQLPQEQSVSCLAQDVRKGHTNVWYYGSGECYGTSASATGAFYAGNGMYRSTDDGKTWSVLTNTSFNTTGFSSFWQGIWSVATDPARTDSSIVYASTIGELNRSNDSGNTWTTILSGNLNNNSYSYYTNVIVTSTGVVYASMSSDGPNRGIWRSADGIHFTNITPSNFPASYNRIVMNYAPTNPNQLYFLCNTPGYGIPDTNFEKQVEWNSLWKYTYLSGDGDSAGGRWINLSANLPHTGGTFDKYNCQSSYDMVVSFLPTDTSTVFIGGTDIFRSTSGFFDDAHTAHIGGYAVGASLPAISVYPGSHSDEHVLFFSPSNPLVMYNGGDGGLFKTTNDMAGNVTWTNFDYGYITTMFYTVTTNHQVPGSPLMVGGAQDNDCLFDNSFSLTNGWTKPIFGDGAFCNIADSGKFFYYEITSGHLFKAQMDTVTGAVVAFNRMDPIGASNYEWLSPCVVDPNNNNIMYLGAGNYLWRNNNLAGIPLANQWDSISTNWTKWPNSVPNSITAIGISTSPANILYYGTGDRNVYRIVNANTGTPTPVNITSTKGASAFPLGLYGNAVPYVTCIAVDPANGANLMVVYSNYGAHNLFYSSDSGSTWTYTAGNLDGTNQPSLRWAAIQHLKSGGTIYWVAASTGLYATDTLMGDSTVWVQQATNTIGNSVCNMVDVRQSDGLVAVATHTRGIYTANIPSLNDIATVHNINNPNATMRVEVYPNPSSGTASLNYYLPVQQNVQLRIYDQRGMLVQQTVLTNTHPGNNIQPLDFSTHSAGIYFCSLIAGDNVKTVKILVVK